MRPQLAVFLAVTSLMFSAAAQPPADPGHSPNLPPREAALELLLSERTSPEAFEKAVGVARAQGITEQAILEARFLFHVDRHDDAALAALAPEFLKRRETFEIEHSQIFAVREDWLAVTEFLQALAALAENDHSAFKQHITEAFWLSPRQASAYAPYIDRLRLDQAMQAVKLDFTTIQLAPLEGGEAVELDRLMEGKQGLLLHFWSPWSRESEATMPDFITTASDLTSKGIVVISLLPENSPQVVHDARELLDGLRPKPVGHWLLDRAAQPLSRELRVQNLPVMVLISRQGSVLFNGHPTDQALWAKLAGIDPRLKRPEAAADAEEP